MEYMGMQSKCADLSYSLNNKIKALQLFSFIINIFTSVDHLTCLSKPKITITLFGNLKNKSMVIE